MDRVLSQRLARFDENTDCEMTRIASSRKASWRIVAPLVAVAFAAMPPEAHAAEIAANGTTLGYEEVGDGPVVLFVHGAMSDHRVWLPYRDPIAANHRFIAYDQRYFGRAPWDDEGQKFGIDTHVEDLIGFIEALDAGPVNMVTWSYGGEVGVYASQRRPDLFRSIVHFEPTTQALHLGLPGQPAAQAQLHAQFGPPMKAMERQAYGEAARRFVEVVFRLPSGTADEFPKAYLEMWDDNARTLVPFLAIERPPLDCADLASVTAPTLIIQGSGAYVLDAMMADEVARCQPNAVRVTMEGVNHDGPYRKPEALADIILSFVSVFE
jgi:pimeloyl-ACP methyl ester carboxylesterase